jgi:hypothetical protein
MENRIKIDVNEEKVLRLSIPMDEGTIVINNPTNKFKQEILDEMVTFITQNKDFDEKQLMLRLINHCTNVEFVGDIFEATYLSHEARMITNEIMIIFQELVNEAYQVIQLVLQQVANEKTQNDLLKEKEQLVKEEKREVRKPKRSKGKIVRR